MKIIFSRKGFDSGAGGAPSPMIGMHGDGSTALSPFAPLREQLLEQQALIAQRLDAVSNLEAAMARLSEAFGSPPAAQERATGHPDSPNGSARVLARPAQQQSASCERCERVFMARRGGGHTQRFCSSACRKVAHLERRKAKVPLGAG